MSKPVAGMIGFASPLLPCASLYDFGSAMFSGSALKGLEFAIGFGIGTMPLLWLAQMKFMSMNQRLTPKNLLRLQRAVSLVAALIVAWRLRTTLGMGAEDWVCHPF